MDDEAGKAGRAATGKGAGRTAARAAAAPAGPGGGTADRTASPGPVAGGDAGSPPAAGGEAGPPPATGGRQGGKAAARKTAGNTTAGSTAAGNTAAGKAADRPAGGRVRRAGAAVKSGYHHGDLRNALIAAAVELAVEGGPERVVLREAARRVGVSPTAAYRHFDGQAELLHAVQVAGQVALADALEAGAAQVPGDPEEVAEERFMAMGRAYIHFAMERPGLYRSAFCRVPGSPDDAWTGTRPGGSEPQYRAFNLLSSALDELLATGRMPAHRRPTAEASAWAMVHGMADLVLDGPFSLLPEGEREAVIDGAVRTVLAGLLAP